MMSFVTGVSKCLQLMVRGSEVINELDSFFESREFQGLKTASLATRTSLLFLNIAEIAFAASNQSNSLNTLRMKDAEIFIRVVNAPIQIFEAVETFYNPNAPTLEKMRVFEKKILGSVIGIFRSCMEKDLATQIHYRDLPKEEQDKLELPILEYNEFKDNFEVVGYRPFNLKECLDNIQSMEALVPKINVAEAMTEMALGSKVIGISAQAFDLLVQHTIARRPRPQPLPVLASSLQAPVQADQQQSAGDVEIREEQPQEVCDLRKSNCIPVELDEDPVLKQYTCAINLRPIRHIVTDPTSGNRVFYEKSAIEAWLRTHETSPITRLLLFKSQLVPCLPLQAVIDQRLSLYSHRIQDEINRIHQEPFDQTVIDNANKIVQGS